MASQHGQPTYLVPLRLGSAGGAEPLAELCNLILKRCFFVGHGLGVVPGGRLEMSKEGGSRRALDAAALEAVRTQTYGSNALKRVVMAA